LAEWAFAHVGLDWREYVRVEQALKRGRAELHNLVGNASKAHRILGWQPSMPIEQLMQKMVDVDLRRLAQPDRRVET
jgi:GDPmannose 4,6-dehydratase